MKEKREDEPTPEGLLVLPILRDGQKIKGMSKQEGLQKIIGEDTSVALHKGVNVLQDEAK